MICIGKSVVTLAQMTVMTVFTDAGADMLHGDNVYFDI